MTMRQWLSAILVALVLGLNFGAPATAENGDPPRKTVIIDFDHETTLFIRNLGRTEFSKSTLSAAERAALIEHVQGQYDRAIGKGKVKIKAGRLGVDKGDITIIVNGSPPPKNRNLFGLASDGVDPGIVFEGIYKDMATMSSQERINALGWTASHEIGHNFGLSDNLNSKNNAHDKMTTGSSFDEKKKISVEFNKNDAQKIENNSSATSLFNENSFKGYELGVFVGTPDSQNPFDDPHLISTLTHGGRDGVELGYISQLGDFVSQGFLEDFDGDSFYTLIQTGGWDLAVRLGAEIYSLSDGDLGFTVTDRNPLNPRVYRTANLRFDAEDIEFSLHANVLNGTGGFTKNVDPSIVPEPATWSVLLLGFGLVGLIARRKSVGRPPPQEAPRTLITPPASAS